jgi:hypothetical protein
MKNTPTGQKNYQKAAITVDSFAFGHIARRRETKREDAATNKGKTIALLHHR